MPMTTLTIKKAKKLWSEGIPTARIAEACGVKMDTLMNYARNNRETFPARRKSTHLTDEQKELILKMHGEGFGPTAIARQAGCCVTTVHRIVETEG